MTELDQNTYCVDDQTYIKSVRSYKGGFETR